MEWGNAPSARANAYLDVSVSKFNNHSTGSSKKQRVMLDSLSQGDWGSDCGDLGVAEDYCVISDGVHFSP